MTNKQKFILSIFALGISLAMVVVSVSSAMAMNDSANDFRERFRDGVRYYKGRTDLNERVDFKNRIKPKEEVRGRMRNGNGLVNEAKGKQWRNTKETTRGEIQENFKQARESFNSERGLSNKNIPSEIKNKKDELAQQACERSKERYQKRLDFYRHIEDRYISRYETTVNRIDAILNVLESFNIDVKEARDKFDDFRNKVDIVITSLKQNESALESLVNVDCSNPKEARKQAEAIRARLKETQQKAKEARSYYKTELRPAILDIRNQVK